MTNMTGSFPDLSHSHLYRRAKGAVKPILADMSQRLISQALIPEKPSGGSAHPLDIITGSHP